MHDDFLAKLGMHLQDMVAGFMGGVVNAFVFKKSDAWSIIGAIVVGGLAANYLGAPISKFLGTPQGTSDFIVGMAGMYICKRIIGSAQSWKFFKELRKD